MDIHKVDECVLKEQNDSGVICASCGTLNRKRKIACMECNEREGIKKSELTKTAPAAEPMKTDSNPTIKIIWKQLPGF